MKTPFWLPYAVMLTLSAGLIACDIDTDVATDSLPSASFASQNFSLDEAAGEQILTLRFDQASLGDGDVTVRVQFQGAVSLATEPPISQGLIHLPVVAGQSTLDIKVLPINNDKLDGTRIVNFTLLPVEDFYLIGFQSQATFTVADDESPARIEFPSREATMNEDGADGYQFDLRLSAPAPAAGIIILETETNCRYSMDFITIPSVVNNRLYLPVAEGQTSVSVKVYPFNDAISNENRQITFRIADASGGVMQDGYTGTFSLLIVEDDSNASLLPRLPDMAEER
jgi:hypothetical protein